MATYGSDDKKLDPDDDAIVPTLVEKIVLNRAIKLLNHIWNPRSTKQTLKAHLLLKELLVYFEAKSPLLKVRNFCEFSVNFL
jgi:hypothetical protein